MFSGESAAAVLVYMILFFRLGRFLEVLAFEQFDHPVVGVAPDAESPAISQPVKGFVGKRGIHKGVAAVEDMLAGEGFHLAADCCEGRIVAVDVTDQKYVHG